jgi:hypothetical protein
MQSNVLIKFVSRSSSLVAAGLEISKIIAQHGKPFSDGDYIKNSWLEWLLSFLMVFQKRKNYSTL